MISSRTNPRIKALASLQQRKERAAAGLALAEGVHLAVEALASDIPVETLVLAETACARPEAEALRAQAAANGVEILELADGCYAKISELQSPEGVAVVFRPRAHALADLCGADARLLVAAGVQDPGNAGALVRVSEAAGASACVFLEGADITGGKFLRATMGSCFRLPCLRTDLPAFLQAARQNRIRVLAALGPEPAAELGIRSVSYTEADYCSPVAICVGAEGAGLPGELLAAADAFLSIPMRAPVESLNVAVAAGILLYRQRAALT